MSVPIPIKKLAQLAIIAMMVFSPSLLAFAKGNIKTGQKLADACAACHGPKGRSIHPAYPKLAGQNKHYFMLQMFDYKQGKESGRDNALMHGIALNLSNQDIEDLATYFATQKPTYGTAQAKYVQLGQSIYRGGIVLEGVPACSACHSPAGKGNAEAGFPALAGQQAEYTAQQLTAYKTGQRKNDINHMMTTITAKLDQKEIQSVASYIAGLH